MMPPLINVVIAIVSTASALYFDTKVVWFSAGLCWGTAYSVSVNYLLPRRRLQ